MKRFYTRANILSHEGMTGGTLNVGNGMKRLNHELFHKIDINNI